MMFGFSYPELGPLFWMALGAGIALWLVWVIKECRS